MFIVKIIIKHDDEKNISMKREKEKIMKKLSIKKIIWSKIRKLI